MRRKLVPHPQSSPEALIDVEAEAETARGRFVFRYRISGDIDCLLIPAQAKPGRADGLWRRTCFEAFLGREDGAYYEFNFSPSSEWAAYAFVGYRTGMNNVSEMREIDISVRSNNNGFELLAEIDPDSLALPARPRVGLAAVIEEKNGVVSFWALAHSGKKPDFHHDAGFVLDLPNVTP